MNLLIDQKPEEIVTRRIPQAEWRQFLDGYSRAHDRWIGTLEARTADQHFAVEHSGTPFHGVFLDPFKDGDAIIVLMDGGCAAHVVKHPTSVEVEETPEGRHVGLMIQGEDANAARLRFRTAARPEQVDGMPR